MNATSNWRDPWPSLQPDWIDPPWLMKGRAVTAWFDAPWEVVEEAMSPDLLPKPTPTVRGRLRFYDLEFTAAEADPSRPTSATRGRIREGAVAFAASAEDGELEGEVSLFLWTDSEDYLIWGREAFGWPIRLAEFAFAGSLWSGTVAEGAQGSSRLSDGWGTAELLDVEVLATDTVGTPRGCWLTPRRVFRWDGEPDTRELLAVRPIVRVAGSSFTATGQVRFDFRSPHPLHGLAEIAAEVQLADGFELLVGADTRIVSAPVRS